MGAYEGVGKAMAGYRKGQQTAAFWDQTAEFATDIAGATLLKAGEAKSAWGDYEAGYEDITGEAYTKPDKASFFKDPGGWFNQTFKGPEGDVRVGEDVWNKSDIQEYGGFKSSMKDQPLWSQVSESTGKTWGETALETKRSGIKSTLATGEHLGDWLQSEEYKDTLSTPATDAKGGMWMGTEGDMEWIGSAPKPSARNVPASIQKKRDEAAKLKEARFDDFQNQLGLKRQEQIDKENKQKTEKTNYDIHQTEMLESSRALAGDPMVKMQEQFKKWTASPPSGPNFSKHQQRKMDKSLKKWQKSEYLTDDSSLGHSMSGKAYDDLVRSRQESYYLSDTEDNPYRSALSAWEAEEEW